ncbi:hypothetical protein QNI19_14710 [Cytophagaceae bacterium DM2B3-1]|uniref:Uncharacterized protein n=1 Tax=Xanthocytophaga flava TaxID=3048013 RepID=A0ABT7CKC3_9BACT|nr:hypothetical protein [Xanthocytophaga flavus]MDJ1494192.1 hypothetical protein [Xanthocytophaga flavus]
MKIKGKSEEEVILCIIGAIKLPKRKRGVFKGISGYKRHDKALDRLHKKGIIDFDNDRIAFFTIRGFEALQNWWRENYKPALSA